jgi:Outer membrane protein beta-barrel domain
MKIYFTFLAVLLMFSNTVLAQMQLKINTDFESFNFQTTSSELKSNLQLDLPTNVLSTPPDAIEFAKGVIMVGILADVSIPLGDENGFKHIAGTGFSGHVVLSYLLNEQFMLALKAGYINYGTQTEEGSEAGYTYRYEDTYTQIPILLGAYYIFGTKGAFKPYVGLALGIFLQNYAVKWTEDYGQGIPAYNLDKSFSATSFGLVPAIGFYYILGSVVLQAAAEYNYLFSGIPVAEEEYNYQLYKGNIVSATTATDDDHKASSISVSVGVSFPIGGK